jgi:hypothetical protein
VSRPLYAAAFVVFVVAAVAAFWPGATVSLEALAGLVAAGLALLSLGLLGL